MLDSIINNATEVSFAVLFIATFGFFIREYTILMKKNDERETRYLKMLDNKSEIIAEQQSFINEQSKMMAEISETVKDTSKNIRDITLEIHSIKEKIRN